MYPLLIVVKIVLIVISIKTNAEYLSYGKNATYSSIAVGSDPATLTDGIDSISTWTECFRTGPPTGGISNEWIQVDLGKDYNVTLVTVISAVNLAGSKLAENLIDAEVRIDTTDDASNGTRCGSQVTLQMVLASPMIDFLCFPPISGRYVTIFGESHMSICELRVYGENINVQPVSEPLNPVSVWPLNTLCGINDIYSLDSSKWISNHYNFIRDKHNVFEGALDVRTNLTLTALTGSGLGSVSAMTLTVFVHPYRNSSGGAVVWMSSQFSIRLGVFSNILHTSCEAIVRCNGAEVMRANVLKPDAWTFLGFTFDGQHRKMAIWRDGEIVKTTTTTFDVVHMSFRRVKLTQSSNGVHMGFSRLQLFDRVLTEVEMKAFRDDEKVFKCMGFGIFQSQQVEMSTDVFPETYRITATTSASRILCARHCSRERTCLSFYYSNNDKICNLYWSNNLSTTSLEMKSGYYNLIQPFV